MGTGLLIAIIVGGIVVLVLVAVLVRSTMRARKMREAAVGTPRPFNVVQQQHAMTTSVNDDPMSPEPVGNLAGINLYERGTEKEEPSTSGASRI